MISPGVNLRAPGLGATSRKGPCNLFGCELVAIADEKKLGFAAPSHVPGVLVHQQLSPEPEQPLGPPVTQRVRHGRVGGDARARVERRARYRGAEAVPQKVHVDGSEGVSREIRGSRDVVHLARVTRPAALAARAPRAAEGEVHHLHAVRGHVGRELAMEGPAGVNPTSLLGRTVLRKSHAAGTNECLVYACRG